MEENGKSQIGAGHAKRLAQLRQARPAVLPSLLRCDFGDLRGEVDCLQQAGTTILHLDVMDGHFVPNLTYGMPIVEGLRRHTDMFLDIHLMISNPSAYIEAFASAGADAITFHIEAEPNPEPLLQTIRSLGMVAGVAMNPETPWETVQSCVRDCDMVLVMSVKAGFGGQAFNPVAIDKLTQLRKLSPDLLLEVDGGIDSETIRDCYTAGCDLFVVGSAIFGCDDYRAAMARLHGSIS